MKKLFSPKKLKTYILVTAIISQIAVIVLPYIFLKNHFNKINWVLEIISIFVVLYILKSDINPVYKIPWIVILLVFPVFGGVFYLVYGRIHFSKKDIKMFLNLNDKCIRAYSLRTVYNEEIRENAQEIYPQVKYLLYNAGAPAYGNTETVYFSLGEEMYAAMLKELEKAEKFIFMEYFIVEDGEMFDRIMEILIQKAQNGLDVRFMYDSLGSIMKAPAHLIKSLREKGIKCFEFNSFRSIMDNRYNNRDHRKICVIDGNVCFTGGINLADEYINRKHPFGHWKDTAVMLKGEGVWSFTIMFLSFWDGFNGGNDNFQDYEPDINITEANGYVIPYTDYPNDNEPVGRNVYLNIINRARKYVYIMTPYLILDNVMSTALVNAAKNGIDVRIITPGIADKKIVNMLTKSYYSMLVEAGVGIYEYTPGFVHAKIFVSDDETAVVGTINLDYRSLAHHFENAVWMYKTNVVPEIKEDFLETQKQSRMITIKECEKKSIAKIVFLPILRLFSPML